MRSILLLNSAKKVSTTLVVAIFCFLGTKAIAQPTWQSSVTLTGNQATATVNKPASTEINDLLIVGLMFEKGSDVAITAPAGWTLRNRTNHTTQIGMAIYYKIAQANDAGTSISSYSFGMTNSPKWSIGISRISNIDIDAPIDQISSAISTSSTTNVSAPSITTTGNNRLVLCFYANKEKDPYTPAVGTTERYDAPNNGGSISNMMATFVQAAGGATGAKIATTKSEAWIAMQVAIVPVNPLPVELVSFTAAKKSGEVALTWETASEKNNTGFEVQASVDGKNYEAVGFVATQNGNASSSQRYAYIHKIANKEGLVYYRLKQIDMDGTFEYYTAKVVDLGRFATTVNTFPNPFQNRFELNLTTTAAETADIQIMDMAGKIVYATKQTLSKGANIISVELNKQPAGIYLLKATTGKQVYTNNLVKQ